MVCCPHPHVYGLGADPGFGSGGHSPEAPTDSDPGGGGAPIALVHCPNFPVAPACFFVIFETTKETSRPKNQPTTEGKDEFVRSTCIHIPTSHVLRSRSLFHVKRSRLHSRVTLTFYADVHVPRTCAETARWPRARKVCFVSVRLLIPQRILSVAKHIVFALQK